MSIVVGFRAGYATGMGPQVCGQFPNYYPMDVNQVGPGPWLFDTSGRFDTTAKLWRPVAVGEAPRVVTLGAQVTIFGGAAAVANPCFGIKPYKNGWATGNDVAAGQGVCDPGKPGWAYAQVTCPILANPGDTFAVKIVASCWTAGQPAIPFPSPWPPGSFPTYGYDYCAIDPNQFHTYFWGTDTLP